MGGKIRFMFENDYLNKVSKWSVPLEPGFTVESIKHKDDPDMITALRISSKIKNGSGIEEDIDGEKEPVFSIHLSVPDKYRRLKTIIEAQILKPHLVPQ